MIPVDGKITSGFGERKHPVRGELSFHNGVDISCQVGTPVVAPDFGIITEVWDHPLGGKCLAMVSTDGVRYGFAHLHKRNVHKGQPVIEGQQIATSGNSGRTTGAHLHFTVKVLGMWRNPEEYFDFGSESLKSKV